MTEAVCEGCIWWDKKQDKYAIRRCHKNNRMITYYDQCGEFIRRINVAYPKIEPVLLECMPIINRNILARRKLSDGLTRSGFGQEMEQMLRK